jgi:hypothetical protein
MSFYTKEQYLELKVLLLDPYIDLAKSAGAKWDSNSMERTAASFILQGIDTLNDGGSVEDLELMILSDVYPKVCKKILFEMEMEDLPRFLMREEQCYSIICSWRLSHSA